METILIADDQEIIRIGIRVIIDRQPEKYTVIEAATCTEVKQIVSHHKIQYAIVEMFLADGNIFSAAHQFTDFLPHSSILVYSMHEKMYARRLMQKGIRGFVSKKASVHELEHAILCLLKGDIYLSAAVKEELFRQTKAGLMANPIDLLSDRELEVIEYVAAGETPTEIARKMKLDITTVSTYRRRAFGKLDVHHIIELREKFLLYKMQD